MTLRGSCAERAKVRRLGTLAAAAVAFLLAGCTPEPAPQPHMGFTAFIGSWSDSALIDASATSISVLAIDGINLLPGGTGVPEPEADSLRHLAVARENGLKAELMVGNFNGAKGDFDEKLAWQTLGDPEAIDLVVEQVDAIVEEGGWDGISIDIEYLKARDTDGLTQLCRKLRAALGPDKSISIALQLKETSEGYAGAGYNVAELTPVVDRFILMAYDQHGPWDNNPGPVGGLEWQRSGIQALLDGVPAEQVELGIAGYGYSWNPDGNGVVSTAQARKKVGTEANWDAAAGEWTATVDGTQYWWSDSRSFRARVALAKEFDLAGVALWSLGTSEPVTVGDLR